MTSERQTSWRRETATWPDRLRLAWWTGNGRQPAYFPWLSIALSVLVIVVLAAWGCRLFDWDCS